MLVLELRVSTFWSCLHGQLSTLDDLNRLKRLIVLGLGNILNLFHNIVALQNFPEYDMASIKPSARYSSVLK